MFTFSYELEEWGWAKATLGNGSEQVEMRLSYLGDPLRDIAQMACSMVDVENPDWRAYERVENVDFADEPGGHVLTTDPPFFSQEVKTGPRTFRHDLLPLATPMDFELRRISDRFFAAQEPSALVLSGKTTIGEFAYRVLEVLDEVLLKYGFGGYRKLWLETDFPLEWHARLAYSFGRESLDTPL